MKARRTIKITGIAVALVIASVFWMRWVPYDRQWRKPAHLIESFLGVAQTKDYANAKTFFSRHQLTNIAAWEGSFENWCSNFTGYSNFEIGRTGPGKGGYYWTDVFGVTSDGRRKFVERIYAKQLDGRWSLAYGLSYEAWRSVNQSDASVQHTNSTP